jgi:hypothetical protein
MLPLVTFYAECVPLLFLTLKESFSESHSDGGVIKSDCKGTINCDE